MLAAPFTATVAVPATSANLGPGFDCLGLALDLYLRVSCSSCDDRLRIQGASPEVSTGEDNLIYQAMLRVFAARNVVPPGLELIIDNAIPLARGLGSSSAAIIAGVMLANAILGSPLSRAELLDLGLRLEGHPDNLAPAMFGGLVVSALVSGHAIVRPVTLPRPPEVALFIPDFAMSTAESRRVLPDQVSRADAVFNTGRSSLVVAALAAGDFGLLRWAMEDRLHQPYRAAIFPALPRLIDAALSAGAAGAALSGAGSTVIALCETNAAAVAQGMAAAARELGLAGRPAVAAIDSAGAQLDN